MIVRNIWPILTIFPLIAVCTSYSACQTPTAPNATRLPSSVVRGCRPPSLSAPIKDIVAINILNEAIMAMGGSKIADPALRFTISGRITSSSSEISGDFRLSEDHSSTPSTFIMEITQGEHLHTVDSKIADASFGELSSGRRRVASPVPTLFPLANFVAALSSPTTSIKQLPSSSERFLFSNVVAVQIESSKPGDTRARLQTWYLDRATHLPRYVAEESPLEKGCLVDLRAFEMFQPTAQGFLVPMQSEVHTPRGLETYVVDQVVIGDRN